MIDNAALLSELYSIQGSYSIEPTAIDQTDKRCIIDVKERTINIPVEIESLGVQYDHRSYKLLFEIDRYVHGVDLLTQTCVIQWLSKNGTTERSGLHPVVEIEAIDNDKLLFVWELYEDETRIPGTILFAVNFYTMKDENSFLWSYNTLPASSTIKDTLDVVINPSDEITPSLLMVWNDKMVGIERLAHDSVSTSARSAHEAEAWAHGRTDFPNTMLDNAKYYKDLTQALYDEAKDALSEEKDRVVEEAKDEIVNLAKDEVIAVVKNEVTDDVINDVYAAKNDSITAINDTTTSAIQEVEQSKDNAINDLLATGDQRYAIKGSVPTKVSELENDRNYLTEVPDAPVKSVNGKTGDVDLSAEDVGAVASEEFTEFKVDYDNHSHTAKDVGARPDDWMPTASDVGARPNTWMPTASDVGAVGWLNTIIDNGSIKTWIEQQQNPISVGVSPNVSDMPKTGQYWIVNLDMSSYGNWKVARAVEILSTGAFGQIYWIAYINGNWGEWTTGFLPLTGGTLSGDITISKATPLLKLLNSNDADFRQYIHGGQLLMVLRDSMDSKTYRSFQLANKTRVPNVSSSLFIQDNDGSSTKNYSIFGEHNKPAGAYTGNGSATSRTISTGGIGNELLIWNANGCAIVTRTGAITINGGTVKGVTYSEAHYLDGVLTLATTNNILNASGTSSYYECK